MKKKRTIRIKNPKLRIIRNNFRNVIHCAVSKEWNLNFNKLKEIERDENGKLKEKSELSEKDQKVVRELRKRQYYLHRIVRNSICECGMCGRADKDMTFSPITKAWFCIECYQIGHDYYKHKKRNIFP